MKYRTVECPVCRASGEYCDACHNGYIAIPDLDSGPALWMVLVVGALVVIALITLVTR